MKLLNEIFKLTNELNQLLDQSPTDGDREIYIRKVEKLLEERGEAIESLPKTLNDKQELIVREIYNLQIEIDRKLKRLFKEIEEDLLKTGQKRKFQDKYNMKPILADGMFLDKRK